MICIIHGKVARLITLKGFLETLFLEHTDTKDFKAPDYLHQLLPIAGKCVENIKTLTHLTHEGKSSPAREK